MWSSIIILYDIQSFSVYSQSIRAVFFGSISESRKLRRNRKEKPQAFFNAPIPCVTASTPGHGSGRRNQQTFVLNVLLIPVSAAFFVAGEEEHYREPCGLAGPRRGQRLSMREARGRRSCHVERKVQADLTPRSGRTRRPDVPPLAKEGEVVCAQPVVAEDSEDICVAFHVTFHEGRLLLEAAEHQPRRPRAAGRARRPAGPRHRITVRWLRRSDPWLGTEAVTVTDNPRRRLLPTPGRLATPSPHSLVDAP